MISELEEFHQFLGEKLALGSTMSPEEAVEEWRDLHPEEWTEEDYEPIKEALDHVDRGDRGMPYDEFIRVFRKGRNL